MEISLCWSWCSRFGVEVSPLLRLVVIRGSMEVVIGLAWWFSQSVAASWRLGLPKRTQVSSGEFFGGESRTALWISVSRLRLGPLRMWRRPCSLEVLVSLVLMFSSSSVDTGGWIFHVTLHRSLILKGDSRCSLETFLGKMWLLRSGPTLVSKVSVSGVWTTLLRYGCSRSFSPSDVLRVIDKEECKLGKNTDYQLLQATSRGLRRPRQRG
ncbi:hypothetical protein F2Q68_00009032 [Brassica cretica]|uniref:Uncharacterized protein n=1 Tax=Brassica cretica TaxID=69181 RepID=A0A8S9L3N2_BRACR|nr:hypothetical protein F2Q68_00009032 [Brassica cretica]